MCTPSLQVLPSSQSEQRLQSLHQMGGIAGPGAGMTRHVAPASVLRR